VLGSSDAILPEDLPETLLERASGEAGPQGFHALVVARKHELLRDALERSRGNVARAARELGLQPTYLHRLIRNLGVRVEPGS
jgi:transcriptional regulator of acetoin/glycerol metabolism